MGFNNLVKKAFQKCKKKAEKPFITEITHQEYLSRNSYRHIHICQYSYIFFQFKP